MFDEVLRFGDAAGVAAFLFCSDGLGVEVRTPLDAEPLHGFCLGVHGGDEDGLALFEFELVLFVVGSVAVHRAIL